ncbi:RelA/SpoT family protein [Luteibaculum oceani]|uniref:Bifunctional (P)ppGpp synthetase/guanosine-3',5'-bis(Diphosphate) 3'-pyrophosphohydrolase n=1 Tax=Luteibaculum oceani TaxID=1294296 RepID=A0A5C6V9K9_9FLAO|nr:bifunctional (p)ppGpp synthetase/guanosine-3',5'-bis(diphosphate) 3'-pyrophosphohydrolase [Luteibaculum oceani]TXC81440.1 bifunctional (p)ppGpp synthetase/guanosine-3',5'-bis(diphosphate) 3'-pyrophosphohydrolase [Luteibaculum oceani]
MTELQLEQERTEIKNAYRGLLRACKRVRSKEDTREIRRAFDIALDAHKDMRRKSGEPYIYHPIAVARITAEEIGLGTTGIICALLHDTVEDTEITLDDIENWFGPKCRQIIDGLTKISGVFDQTSSIQAENFRKMLLTLSDDVRVILIKLADRLHNMRTLESMRKDKQLKIANETLYLYAPLAHRLGLYAIKSELEDLALKYTEPEIYNEITTKLEKTKAVRNRFINRFTLPIKRELDKLGVPYSIKGRTKSISSIFNKIKNKNIPFEEIYDIFAIRIILDSAPNAEKADCWRAYSIVTDFYQPNPDRLRDWISTPKGNGYESLHTTVMSPTGKWVEVQIRTERMDEIAEKGYAAHWKYKETAKGESNLDLWLTKIRDLIENPGNEALDFIDEFKMNLFADEIFIFTPNGDLKTLPKGATALDFAFEIHSEIGARCIGAKVNHKLVPLSYGLKSGDQIEIITSDKQKPKEDWLKYVSTARAKSKIKHELKEEKKRIAEDGKERLQRKLNHLKIEFNSDNVQTLQNFYEQETGLDFYYKIAKDKINLSRIKELEVVKGNLKLPKAPSNRKKSETPPTLLTSPKNKDQVILIGDQSGAFEYKLAPCCNPIPGDQVFGFITINDGIKIHRENCPNAVQLMAHYAYRIIKAKWNSDNVVEFLAGVRFTGIDDIGLVHSITQTISKQMNINMKTISFESHDGIFEGKIIVYVTDTDHLDNLVKELKSLKGISTIERIEVE